MYSTGFAYSIVALVLSLGVTSTPSAAPHPSCEPDGEVAAALARFSVPAAQQAKANGSWEAFVGQLETAMEHDPENVHLNRLLQDASRPDPAPLVERYRRMVEEHPDDPAVHYLYARALAFADQPGVETEFLASLERDPDFPWAHLGLAHYYEMREPDAEKASRHIVAAVEQCPQSRIEKRIEQIQSAEVCRLVGRSIRAGFADDPDLSRVPQLASLWAAEFRLIPPQEHAAVRRNIARDVAGIRDLDPSGDEVALGDLLMGYTYLGDDAGLHWTIRTMSERFPNNPTARRAAMRQFHLSTPTPVASAPSDAYQTYLASYATATAEWCRLWPDDPEVWLARFHALSDLEQVTETELLSTIDRLLAVGGSDPRFRPDPFVEFQIARTLSARGIALDRVPGLVEQGLARLDAQDPQISYVEPTNVLSEGERVRDVQGWLGYEALFDAYLAQKRLDDARSVLERMEAATGSHDTATPSSRAALRASLLLRQAELAQVEGRTVDAELSLEQAVELGGLDEDRDWCGRVAELSELLGISDRTQQETSVAAEAVQTASPIRFENRAISLPDFRFVDQSGKAWTRDDLEGKVALINVWGSWCPPCLIEMPVLQRIHDRIEDRDDLILLTVNVDERPGVVEPIMQRFGYDFPVVFGFDYIYELWGHEWLLPVTWIVDSGGTVRSEVFGLNDPADARIDAVIEAMTRFGPREETTQSQDGH